MFVLEAKLRGSTKQFAIIDEMIRTSGFVRNSCIRHWMDNRGVGQYDLSALCAVLAKEYEWASKLNSQARQASAERAWQSIRRFYDNCKKSPRAERTPLNKGGRGDRLAKSISDAAWRQFFEWLKYYGQVFGKIVIAVPPQYSSQECSSCHRIVKKALSQRTHVCECGLILDRDENSGRILLARGLKLLSREGHSRINAQGHLNLCSISESLLSKFGG